VRSLQRTTIALGLLLLSGMLALVGGAPARAESTTIEITDVYNSVSPADEWFQLYNMTKSSITLTGWSVCTSTDCLSLPTMTIDSFNLAKVKASSLTGWPAKGLDGANDMVGIKDQSGAAVDSMNWGAPNTAWKNYADFKAMLWDPGIKAPDPAANQSFFRMAIGKDSDKATDWLTTASKAQAPAATPAPGTPAPSATGTPAAGAGGTGGTIKPNTQPTKNPATGGEFPVLLALGLIAGVFLIRYFRRGLTPQKDLK
jgi:hypothetical protein